MNGSTIGKNKRSLIEVVRLFSSLSSLVDRIHFHPKSNLFAMADRSSSNDFPLESMDTSQSQSQSQTNEVPPLTPHPTPSVRLQKFIQKEFQSTRTRYVDEYLRIYSKKHLDPSVRRRRAQCRHFSSLNLVAWLGDLPNERNHCKSSFSLRELRRWNGQFLCFILSSPPRWMSGQDLRVRCLSRFESSRTNSFLWAVDPRLKRIRRWKSSRLVRWNAVVWIRMGESFSSVDIIEIESRTIVSSSSRKIVRITLKCLMQWNQPKECVEWIRKPVVQFRCVRLSSLFANSPFFPSLSWRQVFLDRHGGICRPRNTLSEAKRFEGKARVNASLVPRFPFRSENLESFELAQIPSRLALLISPTKCRVEWRRESSEGGKRNSQLSTRSLNVLTDCNEWNCIHLPGRMSMFSRSFNFPLFSSLAWMTSLSARRRFLYWPSDWNNGSLLSTSAARPSFIPRRKLFDGRKREILPRPRWRRTNSTSNRFVSTRHLFLSFVENDRREGGTSSNWTDKIERKTTKTRRFFAGRRSSVDEMCRSFVVRCLRHSALSTCFAWSLLLKWFRLLADGNKRCGELSSSSATNGRWTLICDVSFPRTFPLSRIDEKSSPTVWPIRPDRSLWWSQCSPSFRNNDLSSPDVTLSLSKRNKWNVIDPLSIDHNHRSIESTCRWLEGRGRGATRTAKSAHVILDCSLISSKLFENQISIDHRRKSPANDHRCSNGFSHFSFLLFGLKMRIQIEIEVIEEKCLLRRCVLKENSMKKCETDDN